MQIDPALPLGGSPGGSWLPIETCPQDGYVLVHEDDAIRALLRIGGVWHKPGYPALVTNNYWADVLVGDDARRVLEPLGYRLELRDGCCENPTHWMPLPPPPSPLAQGPNEMNSLTSQSEQPTTLSREQTP